MSQPQGGSGLGLPLPQYLYPSELTGATIDVASNYQALPPGEVLVLPPGHLLVGVGPYSFMQEKDPVTGIWRGFSTARQQRDWVWSDGQNIRVANLTGCPVAAVVTVGGSGYAQASTTVTASAGGSTWQAIVGGMVSLSTISNAGSGYGIAPNLLIAAPPNPGVQATGYCTIASGTVSGITLTNVGAGYPSAPKAVIVPSPFDPNLATSAIVQAQAAFALVGAGSIAAVLCTGNGAPQTSTPTLTISGVGTSAAASVVMCQTITSGSVVNGGVGYQVGAIETVGGIPSYTPLYTNPAIQLTGAIPRAAQIGLAASGGSLISVSTIYDGGLFFGTPTALVAGNFNTGAPSLASVTVALGSAQDVLFITTGP
jgi:hypothetical protein